MIMNGQDEEFLRKMSWLILMYCLSRGNEENYEKVDSDLGPPEFEASVLSITHKFPYEITDVEVCLIE
jgi:hypothetical protein